MKIAVQKNPLVVLILYRSLVRSKKRRQRFHQLSSHNFETTLVIEGKSAVVCNVTWSGGDCENLDEIVLTGRRTKTGRRIMGSKLFNFSVADCYDQCSQLPACDGFLRATQGSSFTINARGKK